MRSTLILTLMKSEDIDHIMSIASSESELVEKLNYGKKRYRCRLCGLRYLTRAKAMQHVSHNALGCASTKLTNNLLR